MFERLRKTAQKLYKNQTETQLFSMTKKLKSTQGVVGDEAGSSQHDARPPSQEDVGESSRIPTKKEVRKKQNRDV